MENILEISRQNGLGDAHEGKEGINGMEINGAASRVANGASFDGEYLTADGVQLAISETFKQLKDHLPTLNNVGIDEVSF